MWSSTKRHSIVRGTATLAAVCAVTLVGAAPRAQAAVTPITACAQTVTTNAYLTQDLDCPGLPGVIVGATGITIDLRGFTLRGDRTVGRFGVDDGGGFDALTVKNGVVRDFQYGVAAYHGAEKVTLIDLAVSGNSLDGIYLAGPSMSVKSSTASGNGSDGIELSGAGGTIKSLIAAGNNNNGINVDGGSVKIQSSIVTGNGGNGMALYSDAAVVKGNRAEGNGFVAGVPDLTGIGILVVAATTPPVGKNIARGNDDPHGCAPAGLC